MIKERLLELPDLIAGKKYELLTLQEQLTDLNEDMSKWELIQMDEINNAVDDKGKPIFSNDVKRKAELEKRKQIDERYTKWANGTKELNRDIARKNIVLEQLYNTQSNLRAICRLEGANND